MTRKLAVLPILCAALFAAPAAWADLQFNMPRGVTPISHQIYDLHMFAFWMMVGLGVVVYGGLMWTVIFHRRSRRKKASQFHENAKVEIVWTTLPFLILVALAIPASIVLVNTQNFHNSDLKVQVTGYQWLWQYEYLDKKAEPVYGFYSRLSLASLKRMSIDPPKSPWTDPHYLWDVNHPMIVPVHKKVLLLITSGDVIHSFWVTEFGGQVDAIPGRITQWWINVQKPGIYRGVCNQICGGGHAYMPVVVVAVPQDAFYRWLAASRAGRTSGPPTMAQAKALMHGNVPLALNGASSSEKRLASEVKS
ncbi:MAG: cytochrome c oxidase subunit II [Gammaproteobacteria bacterium]|nr:cytochrome c oxidase subunit II [Gammaproteobacteria bacterium]